MSFANKFIPSTPEFNPIYLIVLVTIIVVIIVVVIRMSSQTNEIIDNIKDDKPGEGKKDDDKPGEGKKDDDKPGED